MVILILINIAIIIYIYLKYYRFPKNINNTTEKVEDIDSIIIGYINDRGFNNNFDLILAEIIEFNIKGYVIIEYDKDNKDNINKYNYTIKQNITMESDKLNKYEILILNFLFSNKTEITKNELEEKLKNTFYSYNIQFNEIEKIISKKLIEQNIIDEVKKKELAKKSKKYIKVSIILILIVGIINIFRISQFSLLYMLMYILEKVFSSVLLLKASIYTTEGQILKYSIDNYKIKLEDKEFLTNKNTMEDIVLKKEFANSIALHINTQAKKTFIDDSVIKDATKISKKVMYNILAISVIILLIGLIIAKIVVLLSPGAIVWMYIIITIATACVADITLYKKK